MVMTEAGQCERKNWSKFYRDKLILAPMVRENNLPFRLLCLEQGADIVYTEELIDYRLCECRRLENKVLGTIDFVDERGEVFLRTCQAERDKLILQIGSNNAQRAIKAARLTCQDIAGLDFNFGCPKSFSLSGGMGAALLEKPDEIRELLTKTVDELNDTIPVTCKIRILPDLNKTLDLVRMIEQCGVAAIAVHGRTKDQRPRHENQDEVIRTIADAVSVPIIANGGSNHIRSHSDILKFREKTHASSVMIARVAMKNPSIFRADNQLEPIDKIIGRYLQLAVRYDNYVANTKYTLQTMLSSGHYGSEVLHNFHQAGDFETLCGLFNMSNWYEQNRLTKTKNEFYDSKQLEDRDLDEYLEKRMAEFKERGIQFKCDNVPYVPRVYGKDTSPKLELINFLNKNRKPLPEIQVFQLPEQQDNKHRYYCLMTVTNENICYLNRTYTNSKKAAEQATAMIVCQDLGLVDLGDYKKRTNACNKNVF